MAVVAQPRITPDIARDGFAIMPGFLGPEALSRVRREVEALLQRPLPPGCERPHNTLVPLRWADGPVAAVLGRPQCVATLTEASGATDLRWISAYVSVKPARSPPLWWHQDWWCWDHPVSYRRAAAQVAVLCYLSDTTQGTAALRVLPGSHHRSVDLHSHLPEAHSRQAGELAESDEALADHSDQATLTARAGDAVVLDYRLLHGTHANRAATRRDCLLLTFTPAWRDLPDDVRAHLVRHPALPARGERPSFPQALIPSYEGTPRDLPLRRNAPARFAASGSSPP